MTYEQAIDYLESANVFGIQLGLGRIQALLERLGNPQNNYKTIHITGTNGKGSVTAMIASVLTEAASGRAAIRRLIWKITRNGSISTITIFPATTSPKP